jgi:outer membrane biogenesis lipoprotein LolB
MLIKRTSFNPAWPIALSLAIVIAGLQACAPVTAPREKFLPVSPEQVWANFKHTFASRPDTYFWLKSSLNYSGPKESHRSTFELWGDSDLPLRLDLKAGLGITISLWRIGKHQVVIYFPSQEIAYTTTSSIQGLKSLGLYSPLNLQELAVLITGQGATVLPNAYTRAKQQEQGQVIFTFTGQNKVQSVILDPQGRIRSLSGQNPYPWTLKVEDYEMENTIALPRTLRLQSAAGHTIVLRVKNFRFRSLPWPEKALSLPLPEGTTQTPLGE